MDHSVCVSLSYQNKNGRLQNCNYLYLPFIIQYHYRYFYQHDNESATQKQHLLLNNDLQTDKILEALYRDLIGRATPQIEN